MSKEFLQKVEDELKKADLQLGDGDKTINLKTDDYGYDCKRVLIRSPIINNEYEVRKKLVELLSEKFHAYSMVDWQIHGNNTCIVCKKKLKIILV